MIPKKSIILTALLLLFAGCANIPPSPATSASHPANPAAAQGSYPPLAPFLMTDTNLVAMMSDSTNAPEHEHHHDAKPQPATQPEHDHH